MGVHDDDILDFDFVDEATRDTPAPPRGGQPQVPREGGGGGRGPRGPQFSAPQGLTPLLRLLGLVVFAIALIVLLAVWAQGCAGDDAQTTYGTYSTEIAAVGGDSAKIGQDLATTLTTPGLEQADLETKLAGLIQRQQLDVQRARELDPPGPLTPAHQHAIEALQFRVSGLQGMLQAFVDTKDGKDQTAAGQLLATQGQRLEASDVVWDDLFQEAFAAEAKKENADVTAPASVFVENVDLYSARSMSAIWQRIHGASTGGTPSGIHGNMLAYTKATPSNTQLSTQTETTLTVSTDLGFEVGVTNSGGEQEVQVEVTLTIPKQPNPIVKTATIDLIDPGETKVVAFTDFPDIPFGEGTTVQVSVKPVAGETKTDNNSAEYPVVFTLTP
jgi:CARDB